MFASMSLHPTILAADTGLRLALCPCVRYFRYDGAVP